MCDSFGGTNFRYTYALVRLVQIDILTECPYTALKLLSGMEGVP